MGYALAKTAIELGAEVTLISGPSSEIPPSEAKLIQIKTTVELCKAVKKEFKKTDCLIMAAAPADFKAHKIHGSKIKKNEKLMELQLQPTVDILKEIKINKSDSSAIVIGFALETDNAIANAKKKLKEKNLDGIVLNQPSETTAFESDSNEVTLLLPRRKPIHIPLSSKEKISSRLLDIISEML